MRRRRQPLPNREHPAVADVEQILADASAPSHDVASDHAERIVADYALWICACVTEEDAPTWLIYDSHDALAWLRVPDGIEPFDLVSAELSIGGHADPAQVLRWLRGLAPNPWAAGGNGVGDTEALEHLHQAILDRAEREPSE